MNYPNILALNLTKNPGKGRFSVRIDEKLDLVLKKGCFPVPNAEDPAMCCWERCQCVLGGGFRQKVPVCGLAKCR